MMRMDSCRKGIDNDKKSQFNRTHELKAIFAIAMSCISLHDPVRIKKRSGCIGKIKTAFLEARLAFGFIPFEFHGSNVVHWPTLFNPTHRLSITHAHANKAMARLALADGVIGAGKGKYKAGRSR
jgi:hypothetical protein